MVQLINPLGAVQEGQKYVDDLFSQRANRLAGGMLAGGNTQGAAQTLYRSGDLTGGRQIMTQAATDATAERTRQTADSARQLQTTMQVVKALKAQRDAGQDVSAALSSYRPTFLAMGTNPQEFDQIAAQIAANPAFLDQVEALTAQAMEYELRAGNNGDTVAVGLNPTTGQTSSSVAYQAPREPKRVAVGNDFIEVAEDGTVTPLYQGAKAPEYRSVRNSDGTETIVEVGGRPGGVIGGGAPSSGSVDVVSILSEVLPGVTPNSGLRTPEQNARAGGSRNSYHLRGTAVDVPPQQGKTVTQVRDEMRARGLDVREALDEGDHWHFAWGNDAQVPNFGRGASMPSSGGGARVVAQGQNNGLSPAEQRAQDSSARTEARSDRVAQSALRREFNARPEVKEFREVDNSYRTIRNFVERPSAAGDISLIFAFMKVLDPTSTVREGEFATASNAGGIPDSVRNMANRAINGERLQPNQRQDFLRQAGAIRSSREQRFNQVRGEYQFEAQQQGFEPNRIIGGVNEQGQRQRPTNAPGIPFNLAQPQLQARQRLSAGGANPSSPVGSPLNPRYVNPADERGSFANIRPGQWFVAPNGEVLQKPTERRR